MVQIISQNYFAETITQPQIAKVGLQPTSSDLLSQALKKNKTIINQHILAFTISKQNTKTPPPENALRKDIAHVSISL